MSEPSELRVEIDDHQRRITELEIESAFRRQTIDDLDEVVRTQADRIDALERRIQEILSAVAPPLPD